MVTAAGYPVNSSMLRHFWHGYFFDHERHVYVNVIVEPYPALGNLNQGNTCVTLYVLKIFVLSFALIRRTKEDIVCGSSKGIEFSESCSDIQMPIRKVCVQVS